MAVVYPVSPSSAASFLAHQFPRDQPPNSVAEQFAAWWLERAEAERLDPPDVDFAADVLRSVLGPEACAALLCELLRSLPFDLTWKAAVLLNAPTASAAVLDALRPLVMSGPFDARDNVAQWLIEREALGVAELGRLLEDPNVRGFAARALESCEAEALRPLSAALARFTAAEKHKHTRRALARLARKARGRQKTSPTPQLDATALAARIQVDWDAGGSRAASRQHLAQLAAMADGSGLPQLLALRQRATSPSLRKACQELLDSALEVVELGDALTAELVRLPAGPERKRVEQLVAARLEQAMLGEHPLAGARLVALLAALGPRRALLVRSATEPEPWFLKANSSASPDRVQLVHPASVAADALQAFVAYAARDKLVIPCDQLTRAAFRVAPHQQSDQRFELDVPSPRNPGRLLANGWRPRDCESSGDEHDADYGAFSESTKLFASANLEARWEHAMMYPNAPDEVEPDNEEWLTFWDTSQPPQQLQLGQVSPIVFSELLRELTPKDARSREPVTKHARHAIKRVAKQAAPASSSPCTDEICSLASRLARSPEGRADARRLGDELDERAQRLIEAFTTGQARSDAQACALLELTPSQLLALTELIRRTFAPALQR